MKSPISQIQSDVIYLVKLVEEGSLMAPDFHRSVLRRGCERMLKKYKVKVKRWPKAKGGVKYGLSETC